MTGSVLCLGCLEAQQPLPGCFKEEEGGMGRRSGEGGRWGEVKGDGEGGRGKNIIKCKDIIRLHSPIERHGLLSFNDRAQTCTTLSHKNLYLSL